ncbi:MAG: hypothetical protein HY692_08790, partial [Cyanobacteria bacterium NC_groundwater_1444_Ag_S-0.65um_54_12]|nr:hypothetical protein [Cyanobacteria bacterium NC_groundwater_1444_Ag_S-0.65um_54_12]
GTGLASYGIYRAAKTADYYRKGEAGKLIANGYLTAGSVLGGLTLVGGFAGGAPVANIIDKVAAAVGRNPLLTAGALVTAGAGTYLYLKAYGPTPASELPRNRARNATAKTHALPGLSAAPR